MTSAWILRPLSLAARGLVNGTLGAVGHGVEPTCSAETTYRSQPAGFPLANRYSFSEPSSRS